MTCYIIPGGNKGDKIVYRNFEYTLCENWRREDSGSFTVRVNNSFGLPHFLTGVSASDIKVIQTATPPVPSSPEMQYEWSTYEQYTEQPILTVCQPQEYQPQEPQLQVGDSVRCIPYHKDGLIYAIHNQSNQESVYVVITVIKQFTTQKYFLTRKDLRKLQ